jgi:polyisoprenoid-binding protein YceI
MTTPAGRRRLEPGSGHLVIHTRRQGLAATVGHDLTIDVTDWSAEVDPGGNDPSAAWVRVEVELGSLAVREDTGGALPLSESDRGEIDVNMHRILASDGQPTATFVSTRVLPTPDGGAIDGTLTLNGVERPLRLQVVRTSPGHYRGNATVVQSEHGIKPYSAFFGALKLRDEVAVEFDVDLISAEPVDPA